VTMMAEEGTLTQGVSGPQFHLIKGIRQELRQGRISWLNFDSYTLDISFYTGITRDRERNPEEKYLKELLNDDGKGSSKERNQSRAEAHQRIAWPLYNLALAMLAVATLLSGEFNRRGNWRRVAAVSVGAILIALCGMGLRNLIVNYPVLVPLLYGFVGSVITGSVLWLLIDPRTPRSSPLAEAV
jgi:lipopolysaccharide export system permease protein